VVGPKIFKSAHAGIEQHHAIAGIENEHILLQHRVFERQEIVRELLVHFGGCQTVEIVVRISERQRPVRYHRRLGIAELEAVEIRSLAPEHRSFRKRGSSCKSHRHESGAALQQPAAR